MRKKLSEIRRIIREEIVEHLLQEGNYDVPEADEPDGVGPGAAASEESTFAPSIGIPEEYKEWVARITNNPLKFGSAGEDVKIAQKLLVQALRDAAKRPFDLPTSIARSLQAFVKKGAIQIEKPDDIKNLALLSTKLADKIDNAGNPDGKFGQMTRVATEIFQTLISGSVEGVSTDGAIGPITGTALIRGVKRGDPLNFAPDATLSENTVRRWHRLAGIL